LNLGLAAGNELFQDQSLELLPRLILTNALRPGTTVTISRQPHFAYQERARFKQLERNVALAREYVDRVTRGDGPRSIVQFFTEAYDITLRAERMEDKDIDEDVKQTLRQSILTEFIIAIIKQTGMFLDDFKKYGLKYETDEEEDKTHLDHATIMPTLQALLKKNPQYREILHKSVALIPIRNFAFRYHNDIKDFWESTHLTDETLEITTGRFMMGALYLNHFAVYGKHDKVNLAQNLLEVTSSQVIWHEAASNESAIADPRVRQVAREIGQLARHMVHPRVLLIQRGIAPHIE
jgi:hypothetical protein